MHRLLELAAQRVADFLQMLWPRPRPSHQSLLDCKIISHRGEHDNRRVLENTLAAFDRVRNAGCWGIEFDVRWTRDLQPVVIHDTNARRVFGVDFDIAEHSFETLRERLDQIPTLQEVVDRYGGHIHMMIELKADGLGQTRAWRRRLQQIFSPLVAGVDYHILALDLALFEAVDFAGDRACIPVAELNVSSLSRATLKRDFAGLSAQYLLLTQSLIDRHRRQGQKTGSGFAASRFSFYRELNRGVEWIFTNHALKLAAIRRHLLRDRT